MWKRCSLATRMARFHAPVRDIPASYLKAVLSDPCASVVAVHERTGWVAALASMITSGGGSAELGVLVEDAWQQYGIGRHLVAHLIAAAHARNITEVTASVLTQNARLIDPLRQLPGEFTLTRHGTTLCVLVRLPPPVPAPDLTRGQPARVADRRNIVACDATTKPATASGAVQRGAGEASHGRGLTRKICSAAQDAAHDPKAWASSPLALLRGRSVTPSLAPSACASCG